MLPTFVKANVVKMKAQKERKKRDVKYNFCESTTHLANTSLETVL